jgi:hypothetical protein
MPPNTVYVGRPTKWGNPFKLKDFDIYNCMMMYRNHLKSKLLADPHFLDELKGKDLACWCSLDEPCHADILLEVLNGIVVEQDLADILKISKPNDHRVEE